MDKITNVQSFFINLPVHDIKKTKIFWEKLGFSFEKKFSDETTLSMILKKDIVHVMFLNQKKFQTFTNRRIADSSSTQVLLTFEVESRQKVDQIIKIATDNGGKHYLSSEDFGFMYYDRFIDIDGHQWEVMYYDETLIEK